MNDQPSAQSIAHTTEVLELASLLDHRIPSPDKARVLAWAKQIDRHQLSRDDLLDATQAFYDQPSPHPVSVGDVIAGARRLKRDRLAREEADKLEERQMLNGRKAADDVLALTASVLEGRVKDTPRLKAARDALDTCQGKAESQAAIAEFAAARREASGKPARAGAK